MSEFGRPARAVTLPKPYFEVLVIRDASTAQERYDFIQTNCRGDWADDWLYDFRSDPAGRGQARYLFSDQASAAIFRVRFG